MPTPSLVMMAEVAGGTLNFFEFFFFVSFLGFLFSRLREAGKKRGRERDNDFPPSSYLLGGILEHSRERRGLGDAEPVGRSKKGEEEKRRGEERKGRRRETSSEFS